MWVQAFHVGCQLYDNTNNSIEAQNKMFRYSQLLSQYVDVKIDISAHQSSGKVPMLLSCLNHVISMTFKVELWCCGVSITEY